MCPFITFGPSNQNSMSQPDSSSGGGSSVSSEKQSKLLVSKGPSTCSKQTVYVYYFPKLIFSVPKATHSKEMYSLKTATLSSNISDQSRIMSGIVNFQINTVHEIIHLCNWLAYIWYKWRSQGSFTNTIPVKPLKPSARDIKTSTDPIS